MKTEHRTNEVQLFEQMNKLWCIVRDGGILLGKTEDRFLSKLLAEIYCKENNLKVIN